MKKKPIVLMVLLALVALLLAACGGVATPTTALAPTQAPRAATTAPTAMAQVAPTLTTVPSAATSAPNAKPSALAFETKSNSGGSVTVDVKPTALQVGQPIVFNIVMDTHSVDLSDDLTKIAILRDDTGKEYKPTAWEGAGPGGHHREGALKFAALTSKPKYVELVIKGLATVPERVFRWNLS